VKKIIIIPARISTNICKQSQKNAEAFHNLTAYQLRIYLGTVSY